MRHFLTVVHPALWILTVLLVPALWAPAPAAAPDQPKATLQAFMDAGASRDVGALEKMLHADFRVVFNIVGKPGVTVLDRAGYLGLMKAGKIGGKPMSPIWHHSLVAEDMAQIRATSTRADGRFEQVFTLVRIEGRWQLVADSTILYPKAP
ncbi:MAG: nuclear transport factor 2 family protein [Bradymonadia bacterium]